MNFNENAALSYNPDQNSNSVSGLQAAVAEAGRMLLSLKGVQGMGETKTSSGSDAIVVYVDSEQLLAKLPRAIQGFAVIGEVTGEIRPL